MDKINKRMGIALEEVNSILNTVGYANFDEITNTEFYEIEGCILRSRGTKIEILNIERILELYSDRTGYEASYNELRINDYVEGLENRPIEGLALAITAIEVWENQVRKRFPNYKFHIVVAYDGEFTTLRLYKFREEEGSWITTDNLDNYNGEAVMIRII